MNVTRLIRVSFGDYQLQTIPPGLAIEVPVKPVELQRNRGSLFLKRKRPEKASRNSGTEGQASPVQWVRHI